MKKKFEVTGMTCSACSAHVEKSVSKLQGVKNVSVSLLAGSMTVEFDEKSVSEQNIIEAVQKAGYGAAIAGQTKSVAPAKQSGVSLFRLVFSIAVCVVLMYVAMGHMVGLPLPSFLDGVQNAVSFALVQFVLCLAVWYVNRSYFTVGFKRLLAGSPNMDSLIAVGSFAGALYGLISIFVMSNALGKGDLAVVEKYHHELYFESSVMILALVDLGKYCEGRSKRKTGDALGKLKKLVPNTALLVEDDVERLVDSKDLAIGNVVAVKSGASFPADGVVVFGSCFANESAISGESIPVEKQVGSKVIGGTVNAGGYVRVQVTDVGEHSVLAQIISLVEEAGSSKAPIQRLADKIAGVFVPIVMSISLVTLIVWLCLGKGFSLALEFAIAVLVISCPCALGLATPVAIMVATGKGAQNGVLFKNGEVLEKLASVKQVVLDKTGTVTVGVPTVQKYSFSVDEKQIFAVMGGIEKQSEHPLGKAIVDFCAANNIETKTPQTFQTLAGRGVTAVASGVEYAIGNARLISEIGAEGNWQQTVDEYAAEALTCLLVVQDKKLVGVVGVGDEIKPTSKAAVKTLHALGVRTALLTGDSAASAKAVCDEVGIDEYFAEVLPDQKERKVAEFMQGGVTAMVGDGINDAPALTRADVGIAVANGSDIAVDSADVVLMKNDLQDVATAISLSRKTLRNIKQNLFWAFFYNVIGIPLAAGVLYLTPLALKLSPMIGAAAMSCSSLFVVGNALRLNLFKPPKTIENISAIASCNALCTTNPKGENVMNCVLTIEGMMCGHCTARVEKALKAIEGVTEVTVSLQEKTATVVCQNVTTEQLKAAVEAQDYPVVDVKVL